MHSSSGLRDSWEERERRHFSRVIKSSMVNVAESAALSL